MMPNSLTHLGNGVFEYCTSLASLTLSDSLRRIGYSTFSFCNKLTSVTIPNGVASIGNGAFSDCESLATIIIGDNVTNIEDCAFQGCTSLASVTIGKRVTDIQGGAFAGCTSLTSIRIPNNVTRIEGEAFGECSSLASVTFEDGTEQCVCDSFAFLKVPINYLYIGRYVGDLTQWKQDSLQTLTIGSQLKKWSDSYDGDNVKTVISLIADPTQLVPSFSETVYANAMLRVPAGKSSAYKQADGWKQFFNVQEEDVTGTKDCEKWKDNVTEKCRFNGNGQVINAPQNGLNIIKYSDGRMKKIFVK